ncbi:ABC transporter substrate-binding protein [Aquincola sp. MAHUQ-54]|uniref:ABC transporter substrate-binding protein n=1 Tax=Aquincola agrisoli TaxID=3119538 RepID=A0AAW9QHI3_9BURK
MPDWGRSVSWIIATVLFLAAAPADALTLRVASRGDVLSMDPHSLFESLQMGFLSNVYEPLLTRDKDMRLAPALATAWEQRKPNVWRFTLRRGVRFHDGQPFDADDVVFSFARIASDASDLRSTVADIREVRKVDAYTVDIETTRPQPVLPEMLPVVFIMSRAWCVEVGAERPVDRRSRRENAASLRASGTGPYRLARREPGVRTALVRHAAWWGTRQGNVEDVAFMPIASDAARLAALMSGEVDWIDPVPLQDVEALRAAGFKVLQGPELRTIFLGMDQHRDTLLFGQADGNPFRDPRVRRAIYQAIDVQAIHDRVMRGASVPAGLVVGPGVRGYPPTLDQRLPYDVEAARTLLAQAGHARGFDVGLHCPNDRYVNDAAICQAVAAQLARIGVRVALHAESKSIWFPRLLRRDTSFYLFGWVPPTLDAHNALFNLVATPGEQGRGQYNAGGYSNPEIDRLTARIDNELDPARRDAMLRDALRLHRDDIGHIPLHQQTLAWGTVKRLSVRQLPDGVMRFDWAVLADR